MIFTILKLFLGMTFLFLFGLIIFELDINDGDIRYEFLIKEALMMSLKFHVIYLPIYFLIFRKAYFLRNENKTKK